MGPAEREHGALHRGCLRVRRTGSRIDWEGASYPKLLRSFYTMESFIQKKGAAKVRLSKSGFVLEERKKIVRALARKHIAMCVRDLAEAQNISDDQLDAIKSDPTKAEHIQILLEMLEQEPPAKYRQQIDQAINHVNWWHGSAVRGVGAVAGTGWKLGKGGAVLGKQYVIDPPLKAAGSALSTTGKAIDNNKGRIATAAALSLFFSPLVGIPAAWIMVPSKDGHGVLAA
jgi:hypothetical protein